MSTTTKAAPAVEHSTKLADMTIDQLVQLSQGYGHEIEKLRDKRRHINSHIFARLQKGERNGDGNAAAPGAVIEAGVSR